jgi:hypothetical protein
VPALPAGYSGTPLPRKLGLKPGRTLALIGAPAGFLETTLGPLPEGTVVRTDLRRPFHVGVVFARSLAELRRRLVPAAKAMGEPCALWIAWPKKASRVATDVDGNGVRDAGLALGLVDYKIAALDATWSGLCFARRKTR